MRRSCKPMERWSVPCAVAAIAVAVAWALGVPSLAWAAGPSSYDSFPWLQDFAADGGYPGGVALDSAGDVFSSEWDGAGLVRISKYDRGTTSRVATWGTATLSEPCGIDVDTSDKIYVADRALHQVFVYDATEPGSDPLLTLGSVQSTEVGQFDTPNGVAVDSSGYIYVADTGNNRIQKFTGAGASVPTTFNQGAYGPLSLPWRISVDPISGDVYVVDQGNARILQYAYIAGQYEIVQSYGNTSGPGTFVDVTGVGLGVYGDVFGADDNLNCLLRFSDDGSFLATIGAAGDGPAEFNTPWDMSVDASGHVLVADTNHDKIQELDYVRADADTLPPVTTSNVPTTPTWVQAPFGLVLTAFDASSTVASTLYSLDGGDPDQAYTTTVSVATEGTTTVKFHSTDSEGNVEAVKTATLTVDGSAPYTSTNCTGTYDGTATIHLTATDSLSGVAYTQYQIDGGIVKFGTDFSDTNIGTHTVTYHSVDVVGNHEVDRVTTYTVRVPDSDPPITIDNISSSWLNSQVTVSLSATDPITGMKATYVSTDGAYPTTAYYSWPITFTVSTPGTTTVKFYSEDLRGNIEALHTKYVRIDTQQPHTTSDLQPSYVESATVNLSATDDMSGVTTIWWRTSGEWTEGTQITFDTPGNFSLWYRSQDAAGNMEDYHSVTVVVLPPDSDPPVTTHDMPTGWTPAPLPCSLNATDPSGIERTYYVTETVRTDTTPTTEYTGTFWISAEGTTYVRFFSIDTRGNVEQVRVHTLTLDAQAPVSWSDVQESYMASATISFFATDNMSGVNSIWSRVDGAGGWQIGSQRFVGTYGSHYVEWYARDFAGLDEAPHLAYFVIAPPDTNKPVTTTNIDSSWHQGSFTVTMTAWDASSTVAETRYSINSPTSLPSVYTTGFAVSGDGTQTVRYRSRDVWNNYEDTQTAYVLLDNSPPNTTSDIAPKYEDVAHIHLSPADAYSGVNQTRFKVDSGPTQYGTETTVTGYAYHTMYWASKDNVGNWETTKSATFRITWRNLITEDTDTKICYRTPYMSTFTSATAGGASDGTWVHSGATTGSAIFVRFNGTGIKYDSVRGPSMGIVRVVLDDGTPEDIDLYASSTQYQRLEYSQQDLAYGDHYLYLYWTGDKNAASTGTTISLDNFEIEGTIDTVPDSAAPVSWSDAPSAWQSTNITVTLSATDATSGVRGIYYTTNGAAPSTADTYTAPFVISNEGQTTLKFLAVDRRNNTETVHIAYPRIDKSPPNTTSNATTSYANAATVTLSPGDTFSGVASTHFRLDGGTLRSGTVATSSVPGTHTLEWYSVDNVGWTESTKTATFVIRKQYEQNDPAIVYQKPSAWTTASNPSHSASAALQANVSGAAAIFHFDGTDVDVISYKATNQGYARIVFDGSVVATIDLYASSTLYRQRIWSATGLADGRHSVVVEWTGVKNASSSDYRINVDRFDVIGYIASVVDTVAPVTSSSIDEAWRTTTQTVSLSAIDDRTAVSATSYRLNGGATVTYTAPFAVSAEGTTTVEYWSVDTLGNTETPGSRVVRID
ncbi:MAG: hypothetical protein FDZ70_04265, partial [Actinobacteria bacterium]